MSTKKGRDETTRVCGVMGKDTLKDTQMESHEKEHTNSNGEYLLDTPWEYNIITNTDFPFKLTHKATSTSLD